MLFHLPSSPLRDTTTSRKNSIWLVVVVTATLYSAQIIHGFSLGYNSFGASLAKGQHSSTCMPMSSYSADSSDYKSKDSDYEQDDYEERRWDDDNGYRDNEDDDAETIELKPVPMSKNAGNRFVALYWDHELEQNKLEGEPRESWWLHYDRNDLNEDHVMFCRKRNLYNETFNQDSMVDVMRSLPM